LETTDFIPIPYLSIPNMISKPTLLSLEGPEVRPLSIRAKALVFADPLSERLLNELELVGPSDAPVLVLGETGTGKELVARHLHHLSGRRGAFVAVNCGAISETLAESELFGHEAGSFTGAVGRREGWFEAANGGTLFLDEIGDLPLNMQVKLLRVLQEREVVRVGSRKPIPIDVRLVVATNVDLQEAVSAGHFRLDLYYRINIAQINLPPLRDRTGDILPLIEHFLRIYAQRLGSPLPSLAEPTRRALLAYPWPGNIRELENVVHFALMVCGGDTIEPRHLKFCNGISVAGSGNGNAGEAPIKAIERLVARLFDTPGSTLLIDIEGIVVRAAFEHTRYNQVRTADILGITRNVVRTLLKRHGLLEDSGGNARLNPAFEAPEEGSSSARNATGWAS
jgi:DNA-binding NtrC family response regulator